MQDTAKFDGLVPPLYRYMKDEDEGSEWSLTGPRVPGSTGAWVFRYLAPRVGTDEQLLLSHHATGSPLTSAPCAW